MRIARSENSWVIDAPAKINLFLEVLGPRPDGFHNLDTVMLAVDLSDRLTFTPGLGSDLTLELIGVEAEPSSSVALPTDRRNLVIRALEKLRERLEIADGADVRLAKSIPIEAGLGGGSSNAAAALVGGQLIWTGHYDHPLACEIASELGSDINFFLEAGSSGNWLARCHGRGELVHPVPLGQCENDAASELRIVIGMPPTGCSTAEIFRRLSASSTPLRNPQPLLDAIARGELLPAASHFFNRLQAAACQNAPQVEQLLLHGNNILQEACASSPGDCTGASGVMTGSGAASFWWLPQKLAEHLATSLPKLVSCRVWIAKLWSAPDLGTATRCSGGASELKGS